MAARAGRREDRVDVKIEESGKRVLGPEFEKKYFSDLKDFTTAVQEVIRATDSGWGGGHHGGHHGGPRGR